MKKTITTYMTAVVITVAVLVCLLFFRDTLGSHSLFFISIIPVTLLTWYAGSRVGITVASLLTTGIWGFYLLQPDIMTLFPVLLFQTVVFWIQVILFHHMLYETKKTQGIYEYKNRIKELEKGLIQETTKTQFLEQEIKARDEFLAIASHELKTPLTTMLLQLQTVLHNVRNVSLANFSVEQLLKMLDSAEKQSKRLARMINDLLNVSLITTGKIDVQKEHVNLVTIVQETLSSFSEKIKREGYTVKFHTDQQEIFGEWDRMRIEQVITNLLTNAMKYGDKKPISIGTKQNGTMAILSVADQGIGIPREGIKKIFERFERVNPAQKIEGLGVGLYITNQIILAHTGKIQVESKPNHGTTFTVSLPIGKSAEPR